MSKPWVGAPTDTTFRVCGTVDGAASVRLAVSTASDLSSPTYFGPVTPTLNVASFTATGLAPFTTYYYAFELDGVIDTANTGRARTAPTPGSPASFTAAHWGCAGSRPTIDGGYPTSVNGKTGLSSSPTLVTIADADPDFMVINGDRHYRDPATNDPAEQRGNYDDLMSISQQAYLHRLVPSLYAWDDHDYSQNDGDRTSTARAASAQVYRERVPHAFLPASDGVGIWQSMVYGRVRVVVTDQRSQRDPQPTTDNSSKHLLGTEQEEWFYDQIRAAKSAGQIVWWVCQLPWAGPAISNADDWRAYSAERQRIADNIEALNMTSRMFATVGDTHGLAIDDGSNNAYGGFPIFTATALDGSVGTTGVRGGPWSEGAATTNPGQWGLVDVADTGGDAVTVTFRGMTDSAETVTYAFDVDLSEPDSRVLNYSGQRLNVRNYEGELVRLPV